MLTQQYFRTTQQKNECNICLSYETFFSADSVRSQHNAVLKKRSYRKLRGYVVTWHKKQKL